MDLRRELRSTLLRRPGGRYSCAQASRFVILKMDTAIQPLPETVSACVRQVFY